MIQLLNESLEDGYSLKTRSQHFTTIMDRNDITSHMYAYLLMELLNVIKVILFL